MGDQNINVGDAFYFSISHQIGEKKEKGHLNLESQAIDAENFEISLDFKLGDKKFNNKFRCRGNQLQSCLGQQLLFGGGGPATNFIMNGFLGTITYLNQLKNMGLDISGKNIKKGEQKEVVETGIKLRYHIPLETKVADIPGKEVHYFKNDKLLFRTILSPSFPVPLFSKIANDSDEHIFTTTLERFRR